MLPKELTNQIWVSRESWISRSFQSGDGDQDETNIKQPEKHGSLAVPPLHLQRWGTLSIAEETNMIGMHDFGCN